MLVTGWLRLLSLGLLALAACAPPPAPASRPPPPTPGAAAAAGPTAAAPADMRVRFAIQPVAGYAPLYIAADRGYFQQEGLEFEFVPFSNASEMIPALATGQVEAATAGGNPAGWNAVARGVGFKIVLDLITFQPGRGATALVIRKDLYDAGRGRTLTDLPGLNLGITPPGKATVSACALAAALQRVGLTIDDLTLQPLTFPDMVPALANGSIDGGILAEPFVTRTRRQGTAVRVMGLDEMYPNFSIAHVAFSSTFYANRPAAKAFVRAFLRAAREYLAAIDGRTSEADRAEIDAIIARHTGIDAATVHEMVPSGLSPNGLPNRESMLYCYQYFRDLGLVPEPVSDAAMAALWGTDLVEEVLAEIGRVPER
ncbi:MAG TPA: ABC transporter substrate-binding protein [Chloroflexota bacterium]|nr:ABC transporter substrate-binding protein [Chloroflexota bacterium]